MILRWKLITISYQRNPKFKEKIKRIILESRCLQSCRQYSRGKWFHHIHTKNSIKILSEAIFWNPGYKPKACNNQGTCNKNKTKTKQLNLSKRTSLHFNLLWYHSISQLSCGLEQQPVPTIGTGSRGSRTDLFLGLLCLPMCLNQFGGSLEDLEGLAFILSNWELSQCWGSYLEEGGGRQMLINI